MPSRQINAPAVCLPTPRDVVRFGIKCAYTPWVVTREILILPARVVALVEAADEIVARVGTLLDHASLTIDAVNGVVESATLTIDDTRGVVREAQAVVQRVNHTVDGADRVIVRVDDTVDRADTVVARVGSTIDSADLLVARAVPLVTFAEDTVNGIEPVVCALLIDAQLDADRAQQIAARIVEVVAWSDELQRHIAPLADRIIQSVDPDEVAAVVTLIDRIPELTTALEDDVLPVLSTLDTVAPEVHEILAVAQECLEAMSGIPGFNLLRRRGEDRMDDND